LTLGYTLLIFATLPLFPTLWQHATRLFPGLIQGLAHSLIPLMAALLIGYALLIARKKDPLFYIWSAVFVSAFGPLVYFYCEFTAERFHLAEYGLLVLLTYWTLQLRVKSLWIYLLVLIYTFSAGLLDEVIQGFLPNRVYEFRDVAINWTVSFLATGLVAGATWQKYVPGTAYPAVKKGAVALLSALIITGGGFFYKKYWRPPLNLVLLTVDTFRPDHLGCYGYHRDTTPFLDTVARKGVRFKEVISAAPWTSPGMISLFTGLYPTAHGVYARGRSLLPGTATLFRIFRDHGYRVPNIAYLTTIANFANLGLQQEAARYLQEADEPGDELLRWLHEHHRTRFAVWYHYRFLHLPYKPGERFNRFLKTPGKDFQPSGAIKTVLEHTVIPRGSVSFTPEEKEQVIALYDGQLRELDDFIKRLYKKMTRWKLHRNTLLVITGDHGEELFEHGFIGHASTAVHATLYDEVLKIPLIFYAPSRLKGGRTVDGQVRQVDIMPTILDMVGLPVPKGLHGRSLYPLLRGEDNQDPPEAVSESVSAGYQSTPAQEKIILRSLRTAAWKLICRQDPGGTACRLYDLGSDPGETDNVIHRQKAVGDTLKKRLAAALIRMQTALPVRLSDEGLPFSRNRIPPQARLQKPAILFPENGAVVDLNRTGGQMTLTWTGEPDMAYLIQYDVGKGWRNLKGIIPVQGNSKAFGPLPREAWEPLPYWNPYRVRVSPYGLEEYWSDWVRFQIEDGSR
jgi:arylsulfatase A-like enzyme